MKTTLKSIFLSAVILLTYAVGGLIALVGGQNYKPLNVTTITSYPSGTGAGQTGQIVLKELAANGTNTTTVRASDSITNNSVIVLPSNNAPTVGYPLKVSSVGSSVITLDYGTISSDVVTEGANLYFTNARARSAISAGSGISYDSSTGIISASGGASVTSVGLSMPSQFTVTGSPVTSSGTLTVTDNGYDTSVIRLVDDFPVANSSTAPKWAGSLAWLPLGTSGLGSFATAASVANHPGIITLTSPTANTNSFELILQDSSHGITPDLSNTIFDSTFIIALNGTATEVVDVGFISPGAIAQNRNGIYIRYDTNQSDTKFTFVCKDGTGTATSVTNSINADTNYNKFRIRATVGGTILFSVNGGTETSIASHIPTGEMSPVFQIGAISGGGAQSMKVDYFGFYTAGLSR